MKKMGMTLGSFISIGFATAPLVACGKSNIGRVNGGGGNSLNNGQADSDEQEPAYKVSEKDDSSYQYEEGEELSYGGLKGLIFGRTRKEARDALRRRVHFNSGGDGGYARLILYDNNADRRNPGGQKIGDEVIHDKQEFDRVFRETMLHEYQGFEIEKRRRYTFELMEYDENKKGKDYYGEIKTAVWAPDEYGVSQGKWRAPSNRYGGGLHRGKFENGKYIKTFSLEDWQKRMKDAPELRLEVEE